MIAADSSVVVAAFASWHEKHLAARHHLDSGLALPEHCALEAYSTLTRLPAPNRARGELVRDFLSLRFPERLRLSADAHRTFMRELPDRSVLGGAVYDALVAATAAHHGATLVSCDRRAAATYERYGVRAELL